MTSSNAWDYNIDRDNKPEVDSTPEGTLYTSTIPGDDFGTLPPGGYPAELAHVFRFDVGEKFGRTYTLSEPISFKLHFIIDGS
jgi:hypothetical protein